MDLVSVVTPCYNGAAFLPQTIASVAAQTYPRIEHIVVDDGSTDGTWQVLQEQRERIIPLRWPENRGGAHARNRGVELAQGSFLVFLDADDLMTPDAIAALVRAVRDRPRGVGYCRWRRLREEKGEWRCFPAEIPLPHPEADFLRGWLEGIWIPPCAVLWRREAYLTTGGWDESLTLNDDGDLMMRALARGVRLVGAEEGEAYYRDHHGARLSVSNDLTSEQKFRSRMRSYQNVMAELTGQGRLQEYAMPLGRVFHQLAEFGFREGYPACARECLALGEQLVGPRAISRSWIGRGLTRVLGLERKERLFNALARSGLGRRERRKALRLRGLRTGPPDGSSTPETRS